MVVLLCPGASSLMKMLTRAAGGATAGEERSVRSAEIFFSVLRWTCLREASSARFTCHVKPWQGPEPARKEHAPAAAPQSGQGDVIAAQTQGPGGWRGMTRASARCSHRQPACIRNTKRREEKKKKSLLLKSAAKMRRQRGERVAGTRSSCSNKIRREIVAIT